MLAKDTARLLRQVMVSVAATIIATATLTAFQHRLAGRQTSTAPSLTSGGKFAARLEPNAGTGDEAAPAAFVPPTLPILISMPTSAVKPPVAEPVAAPAALAMPKPLRRAYRAGSRAHTIVAASAYGVTPPRRPDVLAEAASAEAEPVASDVWRTTRTLAQQVVGVGDAVWTRITPTQWLP